VGKGFPGHWPGPVLNAGSREATARAENINCMRARAAIT